MAIGEGKAAFNFFGHALRIGLPGQVFEQLQQHRQMEEVEAAGLEDLERCPACSFAIIMTDTEFTVLICGNPTCRKETCRLCKEVIA